MKSNIARRQFLKTIGAGTAYFTVSSPFLNSCSATAKSVNDLYDLFVSPPSGARPFYRWWWNGNRVTKQEVERELEIMQSAGAGGVEINPIALNPAIKNPTGTPLEWLGNEWLDVLKAALEKGKDLGMVSDMIIGTGWPFGGKFLKDEETIQGFDLYTEQITGPGNYFFNKTNLNEGAEIKQALLIPVPVKKQSDVTDVTKNINDQIEVPAGKFEINIISWRNKFRDVMHGAPGGDGPVLDHFNKTAVEKYLNRTSEGLKNTLGNDFGDYLRSMFCDSIELSGANWTSDFRIEFETRNGYDVREFLPLILNSEIKAEGDFADTLQRVRYDYYSLFHSFLRNILSLRSMNGATKWE